MQEHQTLGVWINKNQASLYWDNYHSTSFTSLPLPLQVKWTSKKKTNSFWMYWNPMARCKFALDGTREAGEWELRLFQSVETKLQALFTVYCEFIKHYFVHKNCFSYNGYTWYIMKMHVRWRLAISEARYKIICRKVMGKSPSTYQAGTKERLYIYRKVWEHCLLGI